MTTKNFTQFSTATPLTLGDFIVGYKQNGSAELKTTVQSIINLVQDSDSQTLSFNDIVKSLSISSGNTVSLSALVDVIDFNTYKSSVASTTATLLPTTIYQSASGSFTTNTDFNSYKTDVASVTATLLPTTIYQSASGSFATNTALNSTSENIINYTHTNFLPLSDINSSVSNVEFPKIKLNASGTITPIPDSDVGEFYYNNSDSKLIFNINATTRSVVFNTELNSYKTDVATATASNITYVHNNFLPLTGGIISGETRINNNLTVFGNLTATGTTTFANTIFSTTSALSVVHIGSGPAMWVGNNGDGDIASFYDIDSNVEVLHIGGNTGSFPNVGVKTSTPNKDFTVNGEISASNTIYDNVGNSNQWNTAYNVATTYQDASGSFATNTLLQSTSALLTPLTTTNTLTGQLVLNTDFSNYQTSVATSTATLLPTSIYQNASGDWQRVFTTVQNNSASWEESADILPTVTNYLSTNNVTLSTLTVNGTISGNNWLSAGNIGLQQADVRTFTNPATASGNFLVLNINGTNRGIRLWDLPTS